MAFLSINTISLNSHPLIHFSNLSNNYSHIIYSNPHSITFSKTPVSPITACLPKNHPQNSPILPHLPSIHKKVPDFVSKNALKLIFGSIILVGSFNCRSVLASPIQKNDVNLEEKLEKETKEGSGGVVEEDEEMYVKLLEQQPRNVEALKMVVNVKMRKGKTKEAVKYVEMLIDIEPREVEWRLLQALCYEMMGQFSKAKRLFKDVLKERPLLLRALHGLAMVMHKNREGPAVFDMLNQALDLAQREKRVTEERNIKILVAQMHLVKGDLDEASKKYQELIMENPRDFRPYLCQGIIYSLQDKKKEADEQFEIYRNLVPEEFPQRGFLEDVVLAAKTESREQLEKEFKTQHPYNKA
ncbi:protein SLOW GREEN 1, chloroplastic-like [Silene latifolia]|uniref:protein SLOW GREEN 1, chloroplastic-like n=1 Tax=Silene latifolia TaxID=37657 RepID=UPI003D772B26